MSGPVSGSWTLDEGGRWLRRTEGGASWVYDYGDPAPPSVSPGPYRVYLPLVMRGSGVRCLDEAWHAAWSGGDRGRSWRLVAVSDGTALGYDGNGNVLTRTVGGVTWRYVYDPENRLVEAWRGAERVARFRYDPEGNRVVREVGGLRTVAVDEGYEVRGGGVRKVYRLGGETVAVREGSAVYATVGDHLGSVTVLAQGGSPAGVTRYLPYGAIRFETGVFPTDRRFTGQRWEASLGLYDYKARFYDPALGRFLQPDPIVPEPGNPQALNRYAYVYHNPLRSIDGDGHLPVVPLLVAGAILALKVIDYGWTAYDAWQSLRVMNDPHASPEARAEAAANLALTAAFEAGEPEELLPISLPLDDLARKGILKAGREIGEQATPQAVEEVASAAIRKPPIVIGENMERVRRYAQQVSGETIEDFIPKGEWTLEKNQAWIRQNAGRRSYYYGYRSRFQSAGATMEAGENSLVLGL
jgi:Rhs family protein